MIQITKQQFLERLDSLPVGLQEALSTRVNGDIVWDIGRAHHLTEDKIGILADVTTDILSGFLHSSDLAKEIRGNLGLDPQIAGSIALEIDQKIFARYRKDIARVYDPISSTLEIIPPQKEPREAIKPKEKMISLETVGGAIPQEQKIEIKTEPVPERTPTEGDKPLIIHEEKSVVQEGRPAFKGFTLPFGFFKTKPGETPQTAPQVKVQIEAPEEKAKGGEKKVVHYSEFRTPITPFGQPETFIKVEEPPTRAFVPPQKEGESKTEKKFLITNINDLFQKGETKTPALGAKEENKKGPSIEGNIVDLSQNP